MVGAAFRHLAALDCYPLVDALRAADLSNGMSYPSLFEPATQEVVINESLLSSMTILK